MELRERLSGSKFRSRFRLGKKEADYSREGADGYCSTCHSFMLPWIPGKMASYSSRKKNDGGGNLRGGAGDYGLDQRPDSGRKSLTLFRFFIFGKQ